jgi:hypothetical protein
VTRNTVKEYAEAIRQRYRKGSRIEKGKILDEFAKTTGLHRKSVIRILHRPGARGSVKRGRRPRVRGTGGKMLRVIWEASDRLCSKRLLPFVPELVRVMRRCD